MANSKYEYVRAFERDEYLLPNTWIVVRIDGRGFHKLSTHYNFTKPNDLRALDLMNAAAVSVVQNMPDICIAYGVSDEYSFVFHKSSNLFERRAAKLVSTVVSTFTAAYVHLWNDFFRVDVQSPPKSMEQKLDLNYLPTFDGRAVCYPSTGNLRDYMSWRQVDCHINNLYNTTFWTMVQKGGMSTTAAEEELKRTLAADKNEILWSRFGINYNQEPDIFKKGSVVFRDYALEEVVMKPEPSVDGTVFNKNEDTSTTEISTDTVSRTQAEKMRKARAKAKVVVRHVDIIKDEFWDVRPWIISGKPGKNLTDGSHQ